MFFIKQLLAGKEYRCSQQYHGDGGGPTEVRLPNLADDHREYVSAFCLGVLGVDEEIQLDHGGFCGGCGKQSVLCNSRECCNLSTGSVDYEKLLRLVRKTTRGKHHSSRLTAWF
ncbi:hypothetical protein RvY_02085-2 [Ramazzottius varieornatus]|uniref:Uncharacterized protein n=1 Tax=Ramazzottius varieornatus TaxID=947166 RepID=A0A1D1UMA5_RAMVA|nr:hypothetical protein RvY_02085-2 [Ramazzottius varieornatus]